MDFQTFQPHCRYSGFAFAYRDDHTRMEPVCHKEDRIPPGSSWGICDEQHCPYFGFQIAGTDVRMYDSQGKLLGSADSITINGVLPPEDYE